MPIMRKIRASVTSRPPVDQTVHSRPSRPSVPNRSWYHSWPLGPTTAAKTTANIALAFMKMPQITDITANGRNRAQENRRDVQEERAQAQSTTMM